MTTGKFDWIERVIQRFKEKKGKKENTKEIISKGHGYKDIFIGDQMVLWLIFIIQKWTKQEQ